MAQGTVTHHSTALGDQLWHRSWQLALLQALNPDPSGHTSPMPAAQRAWLGQGNRYRSKKHQELGSPGCCRGSCHCHLVTMVLPSPQSCPCVSRERKEPWA